MKLITDYQTVMSDNTSDLDEKVRAEIADGWQPLGNQYREQSAYHQVMVLYQEDPSTAIADLLAHKSPIVGRNYPVESVPGMPSGRPFTVADPKGLGTDFSEGGTR